MSRRTRSSKKLVAERDLEIDVMKEVAAKKMVGACVRRRPLPDDRHTAALVAFARVVDRNYAGQLFDFKSEAR